MCGLVKTGPIESGLTAQEGTAMRWTSVVPATMKQIAVLALAVTAFAANAQVTPIPFFATPVGLRHNFDANTAGGYFSLPVFSSLGIAQTVGPGTMMIGPDPSVVSPPHLLVGRSADVQITMNIPMRRFGGYFNSGYFGLFSSNATFRFYDVFNNPIGSATVPLTTSMQWIGFKTAPKWSKVVISGSVPGIQGIVGMDSLRVRPL